MQNEFNYENLSPQAIKTLRENGIDPNMLKQQNMGKFFSSLNKSDAEKINDLLNDKDALQRMLSSKRAQAVINQLFSKGK